MKPGRRTIFLTLSGVLFAGALGTVIVRNQRAKQWTLPRAPDAAKVSGALDRAMQDAHQKAQASKADPAAVRRLARLYHANGFNLEARGCYQLLEANTAGLTARDHYYLADIARNESDLSAARTRLSNTLKLEPTYLPARLALAEVFSKSGEDNQAAQEYATILASEPGHPQAVLGLARVELQRGEENAALDRLEKLVAGHPESTSAAALLARVLERRGETGRAVALKRLSEQRPEPAPADPWMADLFADIYDVQRLGLKFEDFLRAGQISEATALVQRIEQLDPASPLPHMLRGWSEVQAQRHAEAIPHYRAALAKGGDPEKIAPYLTSSLLATGQIDEADKTIASLYVRLPDSIVVLTAYADVAVLRKDHTRARNLLTKLLEKDPYLQAQNMQLARILWEEGERDAAAVCLQRVAQVAPKDIGSRALLGEYYLDKSAPQSAIAPLEQALEHATPKTTAHQQIRALLSQAYFQSGQQLAARAEWAEAMRFADKLAQLDPADLRGHALKANCAVQRKEYGVAADALRTMTALQPQNPTIHLSLGDVAYQAGDIAEARRHWQAARQLTPQQNRTLGEALEARLTGRVSPEMFK